jgi:hypothetical protein
VRAGVHAGAEKVITDEVCVRQRLIRQPSRHFILVAQR